MVTINVDSEVYAHLQAKAIAYIETTPNQTLRRLLGLQETSRPRQNGIDSRSHRRTRKKRPKTDLRRLVRAGLLKEGATLHLRDYRGTRVAGFEAKISGKELIYSGERYSMSELAKTGLQQQGYESDSYRGPKHWFTEGGVSIQDLWAQYLRGQKSAN